MPDREKVIGELKVIKYFFRQCRENLSLGSDVENSLFDLQEAASGAITLLKEQEPIEPVDDGHGSLICGNQGYECGCVGRYDLTTKVVEKYCNFCPECGKAVKWK